MKNRREFLRAGSGLLGSTLFLGPISKALAAACGLTPPQGMGPFYPGENEFGADTDLTKIPGRNVRADGQVIYVKGEVQDENCKPIANANVEIWQACASGKYNNQKDPNPAPIDPNFRYWAETFTDGAGAYLFKSIIPGAYPADVDWTRPPHIHFKVSALGYQDLVTQMYFKGNQYNDADLILKQIPAHERGSVIVDFKPADFETGSLLGEFNITLKSVR